MRTHSHSWLPLAAPLGFSPLSTPVQRVFALLAAAHNPLTWPWRSTCSLYARAAILFTYLFTLTIGLLLITTSHQNLIPWIKEELSKTQWLCSCHVNWADLSLGLNSTLVAQLVKNPPAMWETWVWSLGWEDPLEKGKATHSSILAWRIRG